MASASKTKKIYSPKSSKYYYNLTASFVENSTDSATNTSNITVTATISAEGIGYSGAGSNTWDVWWIDNHNNATALLCKSEAITSLANHTSKSMTATIDVEHNADGNLTGRVQVNYNNVGTGYAPSSNSVATDDTALTYIPRYTSITSFSVNKRDETSLQLSYTTADACDWVWYSYDGYNWYDLPSNNIITGLNPNTNYGLFLKVRRADNHLTTDTTSWGAVYQSTYDYPKVTSAYDFNIGSNLTVYVDNPLRRYITVEFIKSSNNTTYFTYNGDYNGVITFALIGTSSQQALYGTLTPPTNEATFKIKVTYGSSVKTYDAGNKYTAVKSECKPTLTANIQDVNSTTLDLTNDSSKIIRGISTARITPTIINISNPNDLNASLSKYVINGENVISSYKDILNATLVEYPVIAYNTRNFDSDTIYSSGATFHPYINPTIDGTFERPSQTGNQMEVNFSGNYYDDYFDLTNEDNHNTLSINWYVKVNETDQWTLGGTLIENTDYTITNNTFQSVGDVSLTCPVTITDGEWDYMTKYYFKLEAVDELQIVSFDQYVKIGQPYFDWWHDDLTDKNIFNVNGDYYQNNQPFSGGGGGVSGDTFPIGGILPYPSSTAPTNWLICDGSAVSRSDYSELFAVIGTTYGSGDGSTTFNLPNLKGRVPVGKDSSQTEFNSIGETGGEKTHQLTQNEMPSHRHNQARLADAYYLTAWNSHTGNVGGFDIGSLYSDNNTALHGGIQNYFAVDDQGGNQAHNNLQPYIVTNYIIKAKQSAGVVADVANNKTNSNTDVYSCNYVNNLINVIYPVGSIYISVNSTNPSNLFGGTWVQFGKGRTLVGVGDYTDGSGNYNNFTTAEYSFGEYMHQLSVNEMPAHTHQVYRGTDGNSWFGLTGKEPSATPPYAVETSSAGSNWSHNTCQPSITVYMWKRTA